MFRRTCVLAAMLLTTTACTQDPAQVVLKGNNTYGRNGGVANAISSNATSGEIAAAQAQPVQNAHLDSISSNDLAPISKTAPVAPHASAPAATPAAATSNKINPWTKQPHFDESSSNEKAPQTTQTASLESIVSNNHIAAAPAKSAKAAAPAREQAAFIWPVAAQKILSGYGPQSSGKVNNGIDIASSSGEPVWAAADGEVVYIGNSLSGYGNMVLIKHAGGKTTSYAHLGSISVDKYDRVKQGDIIGYVGASGDVKTPQLHFAIMNGKDPVDPGKFLTKNLASN